MKRQIVATGLAQHDAVIRPARGGFTLVELLVAMIIIALLMALLVAGAMKFKDAQVEATTDAQLTRLQLKLDTEYQEVLQKCNRDKVPPALIAHCGGNEDRARAIHTAAVLKLHFPETFEDAKNGVIIPGIYPAPPAPAPGPLVPSPYPPKSTFKSVWNVSMSSNPQERAIQEKAVLLYLILTERATGGGTGDDTSSASEQRTLTSENGATFKAFIDLYGREIVFHRWAISSDLDNSPFLPSSTPVANRDPLDPKRAVALWTDADATVRTRITTLRDGLQFTNDPATARNRMPTVVSFGRNKQFNNFDLDDRVGYRLKRVGAKGDRGDQ